MEKIKKGYYYLYYTIYRIFSKDSHILFSVKFRADIVIGTIKIWFIISLYAYLSIFLDTKIELSITKPSGFVPVTLALITTFYFFTFSDKWKPYFEEFDKLPKRKIQIGNIVVWSLIAFIFINLFISVELMKKFNG